MTSCLKTSTARASDSALSPRPVKNSLHWQCYEVLIKRFLVFLLAPNQDSKNLEILSGCNLQAEPNTRRFQELLLYLLALRSLQHLREARPRLC